MNKILKMTIIALICIFTSFVLFLTWLTLTDFQPETFTDTDFFNKTEAPSSASLSIFNWNIGYGGLGENMDFFMDGGSRVRAPKDEYSHYREGIMNVIEQSDAQFYFFQEVDRRSTRSYKEDQFLTISHMLNEYNSTFASNYKVKFIPSPRLIGRQYGSVHSGLATFSKYKILKSTRVSLPGNYRWPKKVFFLDRCLLVSEILCADNKRLYIINTHKSAYDKGGFLKKEQLNFIKEYAEKLYGENQYVVIGGDWNSFMPGTDGFSFPSSEKAPEFYQSLPEDWSMGGWKWAVDRSIPTNRSLEKPYKKGETFTSIIDGFLLSPNIEVIKVNTIDLGFEFSDHNPIMIDIKLK